MKLARNARNFCLRCPLVLALWAFLLGACQKDNLQGVLVIKYEIVVPSRFVPQFGGYGLQINYTNSTGILQTETATPTGTTWTKEFTLYTEQRPLKLSYYGAGSSAAISGKAILNLYINGDQKASSEYPLMNSGNNYGTFNGFPGTSFTIR
jgi:hypothetical protein